MDLLFKRYASPFSFMDGYIQIGRFAEFVENVVKAFNDEKEERSQWEFFLHRVFEGSFEDFQNEIKNRRDHQSMSERTIETTLLYSQNILKNFNPEKG